MEAQRLIYQPVVPGDVVMDPSKMSNQTIKIGGGLRQDSDVISVMKSGKLRFLKPNKYWVESSQKRYVPCVEDAILGIVVDTRAHPGTLVYVRNVKANSGTNQNFHVLMPVKDQPNSAL